MASRKGKSAAPTKGPAVVFCDIGNILGIPQFTPPPPTLGVFKFVKVALVSLQEKGVLLGVISDTGDETAETVDELLKRSGIYEYFEPELLVYSSVVGLTKNSPEIFQLAAKKAGLADQPGRCLFVGENPRERSYAAQAGFEVARDLSLFELFHNPQRAVSKPDLANLDACVEDVRLSGLDGEAGPEDPEDFHELLGRLEASRLKLPPLYRETVFEPFTAKLKALGPSKFSKILVDDPKRESVGGMMMDIAQTILQNGEQFQQTATDAFEEVVSDLYDGFLSAQDRQGIKAPDHAVVAPLVKWGQPDFGPYTWPVDATNEAFGVKAAVVSLPPANARLGLMCWAALGHETAGHDILGADEGLGAELSRIVHKELKSQNIGFGLAEYWSTRIDETASDVMGILNMGPAAGIGIVAFLRGFVGSFSGASRLRSSGPADDSHPADVLRGYLAASTVRLLSFDGAAAWANFIEKETDEDVGNIRLAGISVSKQVAKQSAEIVAGAIASQKCESLNDHALIEIQDWRNKDEDVIGKLRKALTTTVPLAVELASGVFAAHVVSAAVMAALAGGAKIPVLFGRMIAILKIMHDRNPSWGPLFILHPSTISRHHAFIFRDDDPDAS